MNRKNLGQNFQQKAELYTSLISNKKNLLQTAKIPFQWKGMKGYNFPGLISTITDIQIQQQKKHHKVMIISRDQHSQKMKRNKTITLSVNSVRYQEYMKNTKKVNQLHKQQPKENELCNNQKKNYQILKKKQEILQKHEKNMNKVNEIMQKAKTCVQQSKIAYKTITPTMSSKKNMINFPLKSRPQSYHGKFQQDTKKQLIIKSADYHISQNRNLTDNKKSRNRSKIIKNYQQVMEQEKKNIINTRKQLNRNYTKPFIPPPKISAKSYIICELSSVKGIEKVLASFNSKNSQEVASLTKIMTCILVLQFSQINKLTMSKQEIKIGKFESQICGTSAHIMKDQIYTVEQLLYGLMLPSGNDASIALAVWVGRILLTKQMKQKTNLIENWGQDQGKIRNQKFCKKQCYNRFIEEMNIKAKQLKLLKTKYGNSHGLANPNNKSSAYDIAILSEYAMRNQQFRNIVKTKSFHTTIKTGDYDSYDPANHQKKVQWENTHKLLICKSDEYLGIKTGVTNIAGPCLASCILALNNKKYIIVVLDCRKMQSRFKQTQILRKWIYRNENIYSKNKNISEIKKTLTDNYDYQSELNDSDYIQQQ